MKNGKFYGIGVGPGEPGLLTLKAVDAIRCCDVIAVPEPDSSERTAIIVVEEFLRGKQLLECRFSMSRDEQKRIEQRKIVANNIASLLETGKSVGYITLGDPSLYSTYSYIRDIICRLGYDTMTIPGITSLSAAAAMLEIPLCQGNQSLHVLPGTDPESIEKYLDLPGVKAVMKSGGNIERILDMLRRRGLSQQTRIVSRCSMEGELVYESIDMFDKFREETSPGYFSIILILEK